MARRLAPAVFVLFAAACTGAPRPPPVLVRQEAAPPAVPVPAPLPARWIEGGGATLIGPAVPGGTLVLLGGRRAIVHADGSIETEKVAAPEPIHELVEVPVAGGTRLVGRGPHLVFRLDDPLGAPAVLALSRDRILRLGAGPGVAAVWTVSSDLPRFLDPETGREQKLAGLPAPPLRAVAFVDARRGAGVFEAVGLATTADGGATWRPAGESAPGDALRMSGLRQRGGVVRAYAYGDGPDAAVDLDAARLGPLEPQRPQPADARLLRWIRTTGRDPLEAVATGGLDLPGGGALVASHGLLARVDPRTGAVDELVDIARTKWVSPCGTGRAGQTAWVACALSDDASRDLFDPFGVIKVPLGAPALTAGAPAVVRNGEAELRVSPSGGAMLLAPCSSTEPGSACVRQPDGKWKTIVIDGELAERGAGPLADGRVAFLRGLSDTDEVPEDAGAKGEVHPKALHVAVVGPDGVEHPLGSVGLSPSRGYVRAQSPIEEDGDHTLRFVVEDGDGPFAVMAPPGKESAQAHRVPDAAAARLRAGRGIAVGEGRVLASLDGGASWSEVPAPPAVLEAATLAATTYEELGQLEVSELGAKVGPMLRLGWGPPDTAPAEPARRAPAPPVLPEPAAAPDRPDQVLTCTSQGPVPGVAPLDGSPEVRELLAPRPAKAPARRRGGAASEGPRHETSIWWSSRAGMLETVALVDEEGPAAPSPAPAPTRWTLRWHDPQEIGGTVRVASVAAPKGATWGPSLRFAAASGGRALFAVRSGGKLRLVRVKAPGDVEIAEVSTDLLPSEVSFGEGRSEAIAWMRDNTLIVWLPGERPRTIARFATHAVRTVGAPGAAGVPVLLGSEEWALTRTIPIPPLPKGGADPPPAPPSLDGWARISPLPRHLAALPPCAGKATGARFSRASVSLRAEIDGVSEAAGQAVYDVRIDGASACLAGVTATLSPGRRSPKAPAAPPGGKAPPRAKPASAPAAFVRVDLLGKRAEGGERGLPPAAIRRMRCALGGKP